jgi:hypothetical protein
MSNLNTELLRAVELALAGDWDAAHQLVQEHENDANASWIHAVLHKMEGDLSNSRYWYRRAGQLDHADDEPRAERFAVQHPTTLVGCWIVLRQGIPPGLRAVTPQRGVPTKNNSRHFDDLRLMQGEVKRRRKNIKQLHHEN